MSDIEGVKEIKDIECDCEDYNTDLDSGYGEADISYIRPCDNWYVIRTATGKEEQFIEALRHMVGEAASDEYNCSYRACFSLTYEDVWRYQGRSYIDIMKMFPGYLFLVTDEPEYMHEVIKKMPQYAYLMAEGLDEGRTILSLSEVEADYIYSLIEENDFGDYCVHRSFVVRKKSKIVEAYGALEKHISDIVEADYKRRRVIVEKQILGQTRRIKFCIYDDADCRTEGITSPLYEDEEEEERDFPFRVGDRIWINLEGYEDESHTITRLQIKKQKVYVAVELFGREVEMEVGMDNIV